MGKNYKLIYKMVLTAIFSALCFVGVNIQIKLPVGMIHLGNFICIIAALLCGGLIGGISGALGMGIYDLLYYAGLTAGVYRTIILKFIMGLLTGFCFRLFIKKKINPLIINVCLFIFFSIFLIFTAIMSSQGGFILFDKQIDIHYTVPVFLGIMVLLFLLTIIFNHKLSVIARTALSATAIGMIFNIFGEIYLKAILYYLLDSKFKTFEAAYTYAMSGLASVTITSIITCLIVGVIFYPLFNAIKNISKYSDLNELEE